MEQPRLRAVDPVTYNLSTRWRVLYPVVVSALPFGTVRKGRALLTSFSPCVQLRLSSFSSKLATVGRFTWRRGTSCR